MSEPALALDAAAALKRARRGDHVLGWLLDAAEREALLARFPPRYARVVAHHVTLVPFVHKRSAPPAESEGEIVGRADDGKGVEAMVVRIAGSTNRPGGGTYHVTWSLAPGRKAKESNDVIAKGGWRAIEPPVPLRLQGASFQ